MFNANRFNEIKICIWKDPRHLERTHVTGKWEKYLVPVSDSFIRDEGFYHDLVLDPHKTGLGTGFFDYFNRRADVNFISTITILKGKVGVGKTSFLNWWVERGEISDTYSKMNLMHEVTSWQASGLTAQYYLAKRMSEDLRCKLSPKTSFNVAFSEITKIFFREVKSSWSYKKFEEQFINQTQEFSASFPSLNPLKLLLACIYSANRATNRPAWLLIDNVDLEEHSVQTSFIEAATDIYARCTEESRLRIGFAVKFHVVVTARPETVRGSGFDFNGYGDITYPEPDVINIALKRFDEALSEAHEMGPLPYTLTCGDKTFTTGYEIKHYIISSLEKVFNKHRWPWAAYPPPIWHRYLVNQNVRRFVNSWTHFLLSDNFTEILRDAEEKDAISPYKYLRMLIRGRFVGFGGNDRIDATGRSADSPLFFNVYGFQPHPGMSNAKFVKHYLIYLRLMQYIIGFDDGVELRTLLAELNVFFEEKVIIDSLAKLLGAGLIDETISGARNIGNTSGHKAIIDNLKPHSKFEANQTTSLYINCIVSEFEYIASMALVSFQLDYGLKIETTQMNEAANISCAISFLKSLNDIILLNLEIYKQEETLGKFSETFFSPRNHCRPWRTSIDGTLKAIRSKSKVAENSEYDQFITTLDKMRKEGMTRLGEFLCGV